MAFCRRCAGVVYRAGGAARSSARTAATALGALLLFPPAVLLPIVEIQRLGHRHQSSILVGVWELLREGNWFVGWVVLLFSILLPLVKLLLLLELSLLGLLRRKHRAMTYRIVEHVGRWSMMDVLLLAWLVMLVKLGDLVQFRFGPAAVAFTLCVAMSMAASLCFDPYTIWEQAE
jgi:paraquat-inducible protein A